MKFVIAFLIFLMTVMVCTGVILMVNEPSQHAPIGLKLVVYAFAMAVGLGGSLLSMAFAGLDEP
jgi:hypothetical protein